jgi:hypothetical protein
VIVVLAAEAESDLHRVGAEATEVVHILHGARDYEPLLFPEG